MPRNSPSGRMQSKNWYDLITATGRKTIRFCSSIIPLLISPEAPTYRKEQPTLPSVKPPDRWIGFQVIQQNTRGHHAVDNFLMKARKIFPSTLEKPRYQSILPLLIDNYQLASINQLTRLHLRPSSPEVQFANCYTLFDTCPYGMRFKEYARSN